MVPPQRGVATGLETTSFVVDGDTTGLVCCAYLRRSAHARKTGSNDTKLALFVNGTGIYTSAHGDLDGLGRAAGRAGDYALLSVDKPGVGSTADGTTTLDRAAFDRHTMSDLVACTRNAVDAARRSLVAADAHLVAHGHSEGAQVWVRIVDGALARGERAFLDAIDAHVLSGLPLEPVVSGAERQLGVFLPFEIDAFRRALAAHDDDYLVLLGMPWRYLEHPTARESTAAVLERLAERHLGATIDVFHGERDRNAPFAPVRELVDRHRMARRSGRDALDLRLHAYPGATHQLDARLDDDLDALVADLASRRR